MITNIIKCQVFKKNYQKLKRKKETPEILTLKEI